jgi:hypothetical protein
MLAGFMNDSVVGHNRPLQSDVQLQDKFRPGTCRLRIAYE